MKVDHINVSSTLKQFIFEIDSWIRLIEFLNQEMHHTHNRLAEVTDAIHDPHQIALIEHFNNLFFTKVDVLAHVLFDLKKQKSKWNTPNQLRSSDMDNAVLKNQKNTREQIEFLEKDQRVFQKDCKTFIRSVVHTR